ncbi:MAG: DUF4855 domain-containing protein [Eubacteriales bacterium]|nr:DUF4855 domain-containing protein [Eubacteriales bacterium]
MLLFILGIPVFAGLNTYAADENLAKGCDYEIHAEASINNAFPGMVITDDDKKLTDGKKAPASASYNDAAYLKIYRGVYTTVQIDLGKNVYINGFSAGFFAQSAHAVLLPRELYFYISKDGESWYTVYEATDNTINVSKDIGRVEMGYTGSDYFEARYVKIKFSTDVYAFLDEIEVYGTESAVSVKQYTYDAEKEYPNAFAPNDNSAIDNISNLVLMYNGEYYKNSPYDTGFNSYDELLPYAAYVDSKNVIQDTMFDSFLFLPLDPGDNETYTLKKQSGWEAYLTNTVGAENDINMTALDRLVGDIKETLELDADYKVNVFITVPYTGFTTASTFGKLDGETDVKTDSLENVTKIVEWYIDLALEKFGEAGFENLNLTGFYWYEEVVLFTANDYEVDFIKAYNSYVHSKGYGSIWIPYYCTPGVYMWKELGFDCACLQSGYAFPREEDSTLGQQLSGVVNDAMSFAKKYGMGVEMEIAGNATDRYIVYIENAVKLGCMDNGVTMFYQAGGPGLFYNACYNASLRNIYDITYSYIKAKYEKYAPALDYNGIILIEKNNSKTNGTLPVTDLDTKSNKLKISKLETVSHGKLSIDGEGFFVYVPDTDYTGADSFGFSVTDGINVSDMFTINILVVDKLFRYSLLNTELKDSKAVLYTEGETTGTVENGEFDIFEAAVDADNVIISASYTVNSVVPENGYVISAAGIKAAELEALVSVGDTVILDKITKSLYFIPEEAHENSEDGSKDEATGSEDISTDKNGGTKNIVLWIIGATVIALALTSAAVIIIIKTKKHL